MMFVQVDFDVLRQVITSSGIVFRCGSSVDATKTREVLRWQLKYTFEDLIREMVRADLDAFQSYYKNTNRAIAEL
jgi:GDP-D-mannose dehydratase